MDHSEKHGLWIVVGVTTFVLCLLFYWSYRGAGYASSGCDRDTSTTENTTSQNCRHHSGGGGYYFRTGSWWYRNDVSTYSEPSNRSGSIGGVNRVAGGPGYGK